MDAVVKPWPKPSPAEKPTLSDHVRAAPEPVVPKPSREEAVAAVRTLIAYAGDNPDREGLRDTPKRVIDAYEELYSGYRECPADVLERTFSEIGRYDDFVLVRDIAFNSHCEHHMMPFMGKAHIAYKPVDRVVGLSKLARLVDVYARRLQTQEHMTSQIATAIEEILEPARRRGDARGRAHVHVGARSGETRLLDHHHAVYRQLPRQSGRPGSLHRHGARRPIADRPERRTVMARIARRCGRRCFASGARFPVSEELPPFAQRGSAAEVEEGRVFAPKFDADGLVTCVVTDARSGDVLMVAHMNAQALQQTIATGEAWYFSRSRRTLWRKGESSGHVQRVRRNAHRLRPGRGVDQGRAGGRRRLPYRPPLVLLPRRAACARAGRSRSNFATASGRSTRALCTARRNKRRSNGR